MVSKLDTRLARLEKTYDAQGSELFEQLKQRVEQLSRLMSSTTLGAVAKVLRAMAGRQEASDVYSPTDEMHRDMSMRFGNFEGFSCECLQTPGVTIDGESVRDCWILALGEFMNFPLHGEMLQAARILTASIIFERISELEFLRGLSDISA